jgi:hypothetical protein
MRVLLLIPLISSLCTALAVHGSSDKLLSNALSSRADKTPDNPDGEDDYTDPKTNAKIPRSKILPFGQNGVNQPNEAKNRNFDWDSAYCQISFPTLFV